MASEAFPDIKKIQYEGPDSKNPLAFKHYNAEESVGGKAMKDHLRFSIAYWHAMRNPLADPGIVGVGAGAGSGSAAGSCAAGASV